MPATSIKVTPGQVLYGLYMQSHILTDAQLLAVEMITAGKTRIAIAEELNVARETVSRWLRLPRFKAALEQNAREIKGQVSPRLTNLVSTAVDALEDGFSDPTIYPRDKFIMSIKFLELCQRYEIDVNDKSKRLQDDADFQRLKEITEELLEQKRKQIGYLQNGEK